MPRSYKFLRLYLLLGGAAVALVWYLSLMPYPPEIGISNADKFEHALAYAALAGWFGLLYAGWRIRGLIAIGFALMGVILENLQGMTGYRTFDYCDMLANASGAGIGFLLAATPLWKALQRFDSWLCGNKKPLV